MRVDAERHLHLAVPEPPLILGMQRMTLDHDREFPPAIRRSRDQSFSSLDDPHLERLLAVGASINLGRPAPHAMDMNDALVMKTLYDVYFIKTFERVAKEDAGG